MVIYIVVAVVGILAGGFGGYRWGASVERRAAAVAASLASSAQNAAKKI